MEITGSIYTHGVQAYTLPQIVTSLYSKLLDAKFLVHGNRHATDIFEYIQDAYLRLLTDIDYEQKRFYMIKDVIVALAERELQASKYPTMQDFMPRYIEVVNAYKMILLAWLLQLITGVKKIL